MYRTLSNMVVTKSELLPQFVQQSSSFTWVTESMWICSCFSIVLTCKTNTFYNYRGKMINMCNGIGNIQYFLQWQIIFIICLRVESLVISYWQNALIVIWILNASIFHVGLYFINGTITPHLYNHRMGDIEHHVGGVDCEVAPSKYEMENDETAWDFFFFFLLFECMKLLARCCQNYMSSSKKKSRARELPFESEVTRRF